MGRQVVKVVASKDFRFIHINAGIDGRGVQRIDTITSEEAVGHVIIQPALDEYIRSLFPDLKEAAITIVVDWV